MLARLPPDLRVIADAAYDSAVRRWLATTAAASSSPTARPKAQPYPFDAVTYGGAISSNAPSPPRGLRRLATRYDRLDGTFVSTSASPPPLPASSSRRSGLALVEVQLVAADARCPMPPTPGRRPNYLSQRPALVVCGRSRRSVSRQVDDRVFVEKAGWLQAAGNAGLPRMIFRPWQRCMPNVRGHFRALDVAVRAVQTSIPSSPLDWSAFPAGNAPQG